MKLIILSLLLTLSLTAFGAKIEDDQVKIGAPGSTAEKLLIFRDVNNTQIAIDHTTGDMSYSGNTLSIGNGVDSDKSVTFDIGQGVNNPELLWSTAKQKFRQKIAGAEKDLGTGSGGGGGENYNNGFTSDDNANAEDGTSGWTNTGAGTFATPAASDPLEGDLSFQFTPSAQNDEVCSGLLDFDKDIFKGRSCEASIEYIGGDENLDILVVDGNGDILNPQLGNASEAGNNRTLPIHTIAAKETMSFGCPSDADIVGDSLKGDIKLCVKNVGASAAPLIKWDKSYQGTLQGLSETTLPDSFSARIDATGAIVSTQGDFLSANCTNPSTGVYACTLNPGQFSITPKVEVTLEGNSGDTFHSWVGSVTNVSFSVFIRTDAGTYGNRAFNISVSKQGADAKQSVQVYKSIPKVSENVNKFSARVYAGTVTQQTPSNWITGCTNASTAVCTYETNIFTVPPHCQITANRASLMCGLNGSAQDNLTANITCYNDAGSNLTTSTEYVIECNKAESDLKMPTVQPIVIPNAVMYGPYALNISGTGMVGQDGDAIFYTVNGKWHMRFSVKFTGFGTTTGYQVTIADIVSKSDYRSAVAVAYSNSNGDPMRGFFEANNSSIFVNSEISINWGTFDTYISGDIELQSKPTAYVPQ